MAEILGERRGPIAAAGVQRPVGSEGEGADRVAGGTLAPAVLEHHLLGTDRQVVAADLKPGKAAVHHTAGIVAVGAGVAPRARALCRDLAVPGVEHVQVGIGGEVGMSGQAEQAPVEVVVHPGWELGDGVGPVAVVEAVEHVNASRLLTNEYRAVVGEGDDGWLVEPVEDGFDGELALGVVSLGGRDGGQHSGTKEPCEHGRTPCIPRDCHPRPQWCYQRCLRSSP